VGALVYPHGIVLIDAPIRPEDTRAWRSAIITGRSSPNRYMVSLDAHPDRTLGARALEAVIVAHQKTAQVFRNRPTIFKGQTIETGAAWETFSDAIGMRWGSPDITFSEQMSLHLGGPEVLFEHHAGPTPGSCWVIIPAARVVFVGDHLVLNQPPFLAQADLPAWIASLDLLAKDYANFRIVSGRGGLVRVEDVDKMSSVLKDILHRMEKLAERNASPDATQEMVAGLMAQYPAPSKLHDLYTTRLRYGLHQCYARRYRPTTVLGQPEVEEEEQ
jgi:glyoxylase-like metal-dependent hydrolase (beta-lactamase superfamily II)